MTLIAKIKIFLTYFALYAIIGALASFIPFTFFAVVLGGISVLIASATMAVLRTIDFVIDKKQSIGIEKFVVAICILFAADILYLFILWMIG